MGRIEIRALLVLALVLTATTAEAGRTPHLLTESVDLVPEGVVDFEQWIWGEGHVPSQPQRPTAAWVWWAPVIGVTPNLELAFPLQLIAEGGETAVESLGVDARYRLFSRNDDRFFQPMLHVGYAHPLSTYGRPTIDLDLVGELGRFDGPRLTLNVGARAVVPYLPKETGSTQLFFTSSLGGSYPLPRGFRLAAEVADRVPLRGPASTQLLIGPSVEWTRGPFWLTVGSLFGVTSGSPRVFPKLLWAVEL